MPLMYHPGEMLTLTRWRGTVLPMVWQRMLMAAAFTLAMCFVWARVRKAKDANKQATEVETLVHHLFLDAERLCPILGGLITFLLGFFNATVFGRWWQLRYLCGMIMGKSLDTSVMVASYISSNDGLRKDLVRHLTLAQALAYQSTQRSGLNMEPLYAMELVRRGSEEDRCLRKAGLRAADGGLTANSWDGCFNLVYGWFLHRLFNAIKDKEVDWPAETTPTILRCIQENITKARGAAADLGMYLNTPIPLGYTHLLHLMVQIYVVLASIGLVPKLFWVAPFASALVVLFFCGFLTIGSHMFDPFHEAEGFNFDTAAYLKGNSGSCMKAEAMIPASRGAAFTPDKHASSAFSGKRISSVDGVASPKGMGSKKFR